MERGDIFGMKIVSAEAMARRLDHLRHEYRRKIEPDPMKDMWSEGWNDAIRDFMDDLKSLAAELTEGGE